MLRRRALVAVLFGVVVAGCSSSHRHAAGPPAPTRPFPQTTVRVPPGRPDPRSFLRWNRATRTVELTLDAGLGRSNNGYNFDDYGRGELLVTVPVGWRVTIECVNRGPRRASCAAIPSAQDPGPPLSSAATPQPLVGLAPGARASFSFTPPKPGAYRLVSLVPGEAGARMFDVLTVVRGGLPSISARVGP